MQQFAFMRVALTAAVVASMLLAQVPALLLPSVLSRTALGAAPDLVITSFSAMPAVIPSGGTTHYEWTVRNAGDATAVASWVEQAYISTTPSLADQIAAAGGRVHQSDLAAGASYSDFLNPTLSAPPGNYYLILQVDRDGTVAESNEANNTFAIPFTIGGTVTVNSADDVNDGACDATHCSLREALLAANSTPIIDFIRFAIPTQQPAAPPAPVITLASPLPAVTSPATIDGTTQGGGWVVLDGINAGTGAIGLRLTAAGNTVRGLVIQRFDGAGILSTGAGGNLIVGNRIGTTVDGLGLAQNGASGIVLDASDFNTIGGTTAAERNLLSGNKVAGLAVLNGSSKNTIYGNYIGVGADGRADVRNDLMGVLIEGPDNLVGRNVISGNNLVTAGGFDHGVVLRTPSAFGNVVAGNLIGLAADGTRGFPNAGAGVLIHGGASNNTIGGATAADRNVISGNSHNGIHIASSTSGGNVIQGNYIGLEADGTTRLGNGESGIAIRPDDRSPTMPANTVVGNVIASNVAGIDVGSAGAHTIRGNVIGLAADGRTPRPNNTGLYVFLGETPQPAAMTVSGNTISGNAVHGMYIYGVSGASFTGNRIGVATDGTTPVGNASDGMAILHSAGLTVADNTVVANSEGIVLGLDDTLNTFTNNTVRNNATSGFLLNSSSTFGNTIGAGSITGHTGKGIALAGGANMGVQPPTVTRVEARGNRLIVTGTGAPGATVNVYADPADEGQTYLGTVPVSVDGAWQGSTWTIADVSAITAALRARTLFITATQTDDHSNTSEFSTAAAAAAFISGIAQFRETPDGTTILPYVLGGAIVTLIAPDGTKTRTTAETDGTYTLPAGLPLTQYVVGYDATVLVGDATSARHFIGGVRFTTDAFGNADVPQPNAVYNRKNHTWLTPITLASNQPILDQVWHRGQATWYRFAITQQQQVTIDLANCPFNCDLVVYKDLKEVAAKLKADAATQAGVRLTLQGDIMADDLDADDLDADDLDADDLDADDLDADDLDADDLDADDLDADDLDADDLDADDLDADDLDADDLDADDLDADDLDADDLDADGDGLTGYGPVYTAAQRKGLRAASLTAGLAPERVVINTRDNTGYIYIRVAGGSSLSGIFSIVARSTTDPACTTAPLAARAPSTAAASFPTGMRSLILTDTGALGLSGQAKTDYLAKLGQLAAHSTVNGYVFDLASDANIQLLRADWLSPGGRTCVAQANLLSDAIKQLVTGFRSRNSATMEYLINAGGDRAIPFRRVADAAEISRESHYSPPVDVLSPSEASLNNDTFLNDDFYVGTAVERDNRIVYLPELAVGRLVESAADITAYVDMYLAKNGVSQPTTALSSGYDFNLDLAAYVTTELGARGVAVDSSLASNTWTAEDWRNKVLNTAPAQAFGILSMQGHFSAGRLVPADNGQRVLASEIAAVTDGRFRGALGFSLGCHSGYSTVDQDASTTFPPTPIEAFPERFVGQGLTLVGGTGYQYGETVLLWNTERLLALLTNELGYSADVNGASWAAGVPIGKALLNAKHGYLAGTATPRGIDYKVVGVSTVYGSPTMRFLLPHPHARPAPVTVTPLPVSGFAGLSALELSPSFTLVPHPSAAGTYYEATVPQGSADVGGVTAAPYRPIEPAVTTSANAANAVLQGVVFLGGAYTESAFTPRLSIPATEESGEAPRYANDVFVPIRPVKMNLFGGDAVQVIPFQYRSNADGTAGTARAYSNVNVRAYWSSATGIAALADAPVVRDVSVKLDASGHLVVIATIRGLTDPGVAEVWLTYTDTSAAGRAFSSIPMTAAVDTTFDGTGLLGFTRLYTATLQGTPTAQRFMVQAVGGNGRVGIATANGQLYTYADAPAVDTRVPSAIAVSAPASAAYRQPVTATATLTSAGSPLAGRNVTFKLGSQTRIAQTNASGIATATLDAPAPRAVPYDLTASFAGDATTFGNGASTQITITRAPSTLTTAPGHVQWSDTATIATLSSGGITLNEQPIDLAVGTTHVATFTDFAGHVRLDTADLGTTLGGISVHIGFPGDDRYLPAAAAVDVVVDREAATLSATALGPQPTGAVTFRATVTQDPDGSLGDITRATLRYTFAPEGGAAFSVTAPVAADGTSSLVQTLGAGVYRVEVAIEGHFIGDTFAYTLPVYDPTTFVTGGGWLAGSAALTPATPARKTSFGFNAKYQPDGHTPQGTMLVQLGDEKGSTPIAVRAASIEWLVITGTQAEFTGAATVDGRAGYRYHVIANDLASGDTFTVRVWDATGSEASPLYAVSGTIGGGNIAVRN